MNFSMNRNTSVVLPSSEIALSDELTLTDSPGGGVIIKDIQQDSQVAKVGTLKKGDELNSVTIHFDDLNSKEVGKILKYTEPYKTSLKLNTKSELKSPTYGYKSSYMGSSDETYLKLYNSKIKPHLKPAKPSVDAGGLTVNGITPLIDARRPKISSEFDMNLKASPTIGLKTPIDINGPHGKIQMPDVKASTPKIGGGLITSDINVESPRGAIKMPGNDFKGPSFKMPSAHLSGIETTSPKGDFDVNLPNAELPAPTFKMSSPDLQGPNVSALDTNLNLKAPNVQGVGLNLSSPNIDLEAPNFQTSNIDISAPKVGTEGKLRIPKFKKSAFSLNGNDPKGPELDVSIPGVKTDIKTPDMDLNGGVDLPEAKGKWNMPSLQMPSFGLSGTRGPNVDFDGSIKAPRVDVSAPKPKGNFESPHVDLKLPKGELDANLPDAELNGGKFKLPGVNWPGNKLPLSRPDNGLKLSKGHIDLSVPDLKGDIKGPSLDLKGPNVDLNTPSVDIPDAKSKFKMPNMASFGMSGPKAPDLDVDGSVKVPGIDVSAPNINGNFESPNVDLKLPKGDLDINMPYAEIKKPKFKMPNFSMPSSNLSMPDTNLNLKAPTMAGDFDAKLKKPNLDISGIKGPDMNFGGNLKIPNEDISSPDLKAGFGSAGIGFKKPQINADYDMPDMNLDVPEVKLKGKGIKKPSLNMSAGNVSVPDVDLNLSAPNVDLAAPKLQGDYNGPNIDLKSPKIDGSGAEGKFKFPKFKKPTFTLSRNKPKGPEVDVPNVKADIKSPDMDLNGGVDLPEAKGKWKMPSWHLPSFGFSGSKGPDVDFDGSLKAPGIDVSAPNLKGNFESPDVDLKFPKGKIDANMPDAELTGGKFKLPEVKWPSNKLSSSGPEKDLKLPKGQIDLSAPDIKGDIKGPSLDVKGPNIDLSAPNVDVPDAKAKFKMPSLPMASFGLAGPKAPGLDVDGSVKVPGMDLSGPNMKGNFEIPNVDLNIPKGDLDINMPYAEIKKPKFKMPNFSMPSANLSTPDTSLNLKAPVVTGDLDAKLNKPNLDISGIKGPDMNFGGNLKIPNADISSPDLKAGFGSAGIGFKKPQINADYDMPDMNLDVPEVKLKGKGIKKPSLNMSAGNISVPDVDLNLSAPNVDLAAPKLQGDFKGPNIALNAPKVDGIGAQGKFKFPKFKKPTFSLSGNKPKVPDLNLSVPDVKTDIKTPDMDLNGGVDLPEAKGKWKMPGLHLSSFGLPGPKGPDVDFDGSVNAPGVDVSGPNLKGNFESPNVDLKLPKGEIDANLPDGKLTGGKFKLPGVNWPSSKLSLSGPENGLNLPKGQVDFSAPDIKGDIKGPGLDLKGPNMDINAPSVDMPDAKAKFQMPKLKMPSFGFSGPKGADVDLDGSVKAPSVDVSAPNLKGNFESPNVDLKLPKGEIDANLPDGKLTGGKFKLPGVNWPSSKLSLSGPENGLNLPKGQVDFSAPDIKGDIKGPGLDLKGPNMDINAPSVDMPDAKAKFQMPKLKMPSFGFSGPKGADVDLDGSVKAPSVDVSAPNLKGNFESPNVDLKLPKGEIDANLPDAELTGGKFKLPGVNWLSNKLSLSGPENGLNLPKGQVDFSAPDIKGDIKGPGLDLKGPNMDINAPSVDMPDAKAKFQMPKLKMPSFGFSGPKGADVDLDGSVKAPSVDVSAPNLKGNFESPNVDLKLPKGEIDANLPDAELTGGKFKLPGVNWPSNKLSLSGPENGLNLPKGQVDFSAPDIKGDIKGPGLDLKGPNMDINAPSVDMPDAKAKFQMPSLKMPSFGFSGPKGADVDLDGSVKAPRVDLSAPNLKGNFESPDVDLQHPKGEIDANLPDAELAGGKFKLPGVNWPSNKLSLSGPDNGLNLPKGQVNLSAPDIQGDIRGRSIDMKAPHLSVSKPKSMFQMPKVELPSIRMSGPKTPDLDVNSSVKVPSVDVAGPSIKGNYKSPDFRMDVPNVSTGNVDLNLPTANIKGGAGIDMSGFPNRNLQGANKGVKDTKFGVSSPNLNGEFREVGVDVSSPNPSAQLYSPKLKVSTDDNINMQNKFSRKTFKLRSSSASDLDDITAQGIYNTNLQARTSSSKNVNDPSMSKKNKFNLSNLFTFNHKSKGSVDFTKAQPATSPGTFTPNSRFPEIEFAVSKH